MSLPPLGFAGGFSGSGELLQVIARVAVERKKYAFDEIDKCKRFLDIQIVKLENLN